MTIQTKYLPATNTRGSRIKATHVAPHFHKTVTVGYDHALHRAGNHRAAMTALCAKYNLSADAYVGDNFGGAVYWVNRYLAPF